METVSYTLRIPKALMEELVGEAGTTGKSVAKIIIGRLTGGVAQLVEQGTHNAQVERSSRSPATKPSRLTPKPDSVVESSKGAPCKGCGALGGMHQKKCPNAH